MVTLEQIKLLESKVAKAIDIVTRITEENSYLKGKLEAYQKRIDELEVLIQRFKEDQGRIEEGIISALDRLSKFEEAVESAVKQDIIAAPESAPVKESAPAKSPEPAPRERVAAAKLEARPVIAATYIPAEEDTDDALIFDEGEDAGLDTGDAVLDDGAELDIF
jgi:predicted nuclease with TOPRIM domain